MKKLFSEFQTILIAVGIAMLIRIFIVEPYEIPSGSMIPTLHIGDHILVRKFEYGIRLPLVNKYIITWNKPRRGDIIVFRYPLDQSKNFIKRVIGLPGDTVEIREKMIFINGKPLKDLYGMYKDRRILPNRDEFGPIVVPHGYYFVMGDNRDSSNDSRMWALELGLTYDPKYSLVEMGLIKGKAYVIYWSVRNNPSATPAPPITTFFRWLWYWTKAFFQYFTRIDWNRMGKQIYLP